MQFDTAIVLGAGAFGTSIAGVLGSNFKRVILKVRSQDVYDGLKEGENKVYLPGHKLHPSLVPALTFDEVNKNIQGKVQLLVSGLPSSAIRSYCKEHHKELLVYLDQDIPVISLAKGIDTDTLEFPDDMFFSEFPSHRDQFGFLSGPSFAKEIIEKQITLVSIAGRSTKHLKLMSEMVDSSYFKVFLNYDVKGLLLGGALKNVLAIAGGILEGFGYNHNTRAAMITRGIFEMLRFGVVFNARPETFYGLSGMGDLILTTTGDLSRNKSFGMEIAKGRKAEEIIASQRSVVEGYKTTKAVYELAKKYEIRCRIFTGIYEVLYGQKKPEDVIQDLMQTPTRFEI